MPPPPSPFKNFPLFLIVEVLLFVQGLLTLGYSILEAARKVLLDPATTSTTLTSSGTPGSSRRLPSPGSARTPTTSHQRSTPTMNRSAGGSTGHIQFHGQNS